MRILPPTRMATPSTPNKIEFHFCTSASCTPRRSVRAKGTTGTRMPYVKTSEKMAMQTTMRVKALDSRMDRAHTAIARKSTKEWWSTDTSMRAYCTHRAYGRCGLSHHSQLHVCIAINWHLRHHDPTVFPGLIFQRRSMDRTI